MRHVNRLLILACMVVISMSATDFKPLQIQSRTRDLTGQVFGRWKVLRFAGRSKSNDRLWECVCSCGTVKITKGGSLCRGASRSCGCLSVALTKVRNRTHGQSKTKDYNCWNAMVSRCYNSNLKCFKNYGGRGVGVCKRWRFGEKGKSGFECMMQDMGPRPKGLTIERKNNNGSYTPSNCAWGTRRVQGANKRNNILISLEGTSHIAAEWSRRLNLCPSTVYKRYHLGWTPQQILSA